MKKIKFFGTDLETFMGIFIAIVTIIATYTTNQAGDFIQEANDLNRLALNHLVNATDWWSYYQAHRLRITVFENSIIRASGKDVFKELERYDDDLTQAKAESMRPQLLEKLKSEGINQAEMDSYISGLEKSSLKAKIGQENALNEEKSQRDNATAANIATDYATLYQTITLILIVSMGLGGIAVLLNIERLAYVSILIGIVGMAYTTLILFFPTVVGLAAL